jgi:hypothetical protein
MSSDAPRRVAQLPVELSVPLPATHPQREELGRVARKSPVAKSLHPDVSMAVRFVWQA